MEKQKKEHLTISETLVISCEVCAVRESERDMVEVGGKREREDDEDRGKDGGENEYQSGNKDEENVAREVNKMGEGGKNMTTIEGREEINLEEDKELVVGKSKKWDLLKTTCLIT